MNSFVVFTLLFPRNIMFSFCCIPALLAGLSFVISVIFIPCSWNAAPSSGAVLIMSISVIAAVIMFEKLPAASTDSCSFLFLCLSVSSSGSTNAAGSIGISMHTKAIPVLFRGILCVLAIIPCANSCTSATMNIVIIQYMNGTKNTPFASSGSTGCIPAVVSGFRKRFIVFSISSAPISIIPMNPMIIPVYPRNFVVCGCFLAILSILFRPLFDLNITIYKNGKSIFWILTFFLFLYTNTVIAVIRTSAVIVFMFIELISFFLV